MSELSKEQLLDYVRKQKTKTKTLKDAPPEPLPASVAAVAATAAAPSNACRSMSTLPYKRRPSRCR
jgi:hypothetical protein